MFLTSKDIINFDESALKAFLDKKIMEGHHIDYKVDLSGGTIQSKEQNSLKTLPLLQTPAAGI